MTTGTDQEFITSGAGEARRMPHRRDAEPWRDHGESAAAAVAAPDRLPALVAARGAAVVALLDAVDGVAHV